MRCLVNDRRCSCIAPGIVAGMRKEERDGQYTISREPGRKGWGSTPSLITIVRGFVRAIAGKRRKVEGRGASGSLE